MQCVQYHLLPKVHAHPLEQQCVAHTPGSTPMRRRRCSDLPCGQASKIAAVSCPRMVATRVTTQEAPAETLPQAHAETLLCTSVTASTFEQAVAEIQQIAEAGADLIELRLDMLTDFQVEQHLQQLLQTTDIPKVVTMRPVWEGSVPQCDMRLQNQFTSFAI